MIQKCEIAKKTYRKIHIKNVRISKISKHMPVKIRLPWKRQIAWTKTCHTKFLPDEF